VNRVSNNSWNTAPLTETAYRIDCETPGAAITYSTFNASVDTVSSATSGFGANSEPTSPYNSNNADITTSQLTTMAANTNYSITGTNYLKIGDSDLYTARKDYIAAKAIKSSGTPTLNTSGTAYEGAFKTVIVYRNPPNDSGTLGTDRFVKIEATNLRNGAVTISGFPMSYNDMTGKGSKNLYRNPDATSD